MWIEEVLLYTHILDISFSIDEYKLYKSLVFDLDALSVAQMFFSISLALISSNTKFYLENVSS